MRACLLSPAFGRLLLPSYLGPPTLLVGCRNMFIERRVRIYPGLRAETHHGGTIHIGEGVSIGQNCHITAMGKLAIGEGTVLVVAGASRNVKLTVLLSPLKESIAKVADVGKFPI